MNELMSYQMAFNLALMGLDNVLKERPKTFSSGLPLERELKYHLNVDKKRIMAYQTITYIPECESLRFITRFEESQDKKDFEDGSAIKFFDVYMDIDIHLNKADIFLINVENGEKIGINYTQDDLNLITDKLKTIAESVVYDESLNTYKESKETREFLYQSLMDQALDNKDYDLAREIYNEYH